MDKYMKLMCIKGLLMSLDEQLGMRYQKDGLSESTKLIITDKYYDAILEQLEEEEDVKKKKFILALHKQGVISEEQKLELLYPKSKNVGDETPEWVFNIIVNGRRHVIYTPEENQTIDWEKVLLLSDLAKTGNEIFTITFTYNGDHIKDSGGVLEVSTSIEVKEGMIFNVKKEN